MCGQLRAGAVVAGYGAGADDVRCGMGAGGVAISAPLD